MSQDPSAIPTVVLYGDFNCPFSAVAHDRSRRLEDAGRVRVEWRCVEHDPGIGTSVTALSDEQRAEFEAELAQVRELLASDEADHRRVPSRRLDTGHLNLLHAATESSRRSELRTALFDAYWCDDLDLADHSVVDRIAEALELRPDEADGEATHPTDAAERAVAECQRQWNELPRPIVPAMVLPDGYVSRGLGALDRLAVGSLDPSAGRR